MSACVCGRRCAGSGLSQGCLRQVGLRRRCLRRSLRQTRSTKPLDVRRNVRAHEMARLGNGHVAYLVCRAPPTDKSRAVLPAAGRSPPVDRRGRTSSVSTFPRILCEGPPNQWPRAIDSASQSVCERRTDGRGAEESGLSARVDQRRAVATSATLHLRRAQKLPHGRAQLVRGHSNAIRTPPLRATSHRGASQRSWALCKSRPAPSGRRLRSTASLRRAQKLPRGRARSSLAGTTTRPAHPSAYD